MTQADCPTTSSRPADADVDDPFVTFFRDSPVALAMADETGRFAMVNGALCRLLGREAASLVGHSAAEVTHPDDLPLHDQIPAMMAASVDGRVAIDLRYVRPTGETVHAHVVLATFAGPAGRTWTAAHIQDVTEQRVLAAQVARSQQITATLARVARAQHGRGEVREEIVDAVVDVVAASAVALVEADVSLATVTASRGLSISATPEEGQDPNLMVRQVSETGAAVFVPDVAVDPRVNATFVRATGARSIYYQPVSIAQDVVAVLVVAWDAPVETMPEEERDLIELLAAETSRVLHSERSRAELERAARTDSLTGLANRRAWTDYAERVESDPAAHDEPLTVALLDLDDFKSYNDTYGHARGDELLAGFAADLRAVAAPGSLVARWGGEEFVLTYPGLTSQQARSLLAPLLVGGRSGRTCSIGLAGRGSGEPLEAVVVRADEALYRAKGLGKARIEVDRGTEPTPAPR